MYIRYLTGLKDNVVHASTQIMFLVLDVPRQYRHYLGKVLAQKHALRMLYNMGCTYSFGNATIQPTQSPLVVAYNVVVCVLRITCDICTPEVLRKGTINHTQSVPSYLVNIKLFKSITADTRLQYYG